MRGPDGPPDVGPYLALLVERGRQVAVDSVRDLSSNPRRKTLPASARLKALEWMVGDWRQSSVGPAVQGSCRWDKNDYSPPVGLHDQRGAATSLMSVSRADRMGPADRVVFLLLDL